VRKDIETYLEAANEATAKRISERIGLPQLDVAKELNRMHADGVIEREKRKGGGNEYVYWLARRNPPVLAKPELAQEIPAPPTIPPGAGASSVSLKREPEPVPTEAEKAFAKLAAQTRELIEIFGLPPTMTEAIDTARAMVEIAKATASERDALRLKCDELEVDNESNKRSLAKLRQNCADLEARIDELTLGPVGSKSPLFVTVGRCAKAQRHDSLEKAKKRGQRLVRGQKETEVLVLEPIGRVVRGTEWLPRR
jgi:hypothetical protein